MTELLVDPSVWVGFLTLVMLEIILGIDNLVFVAIIADKLAAKKRDMARFIGLGLALIIRLALLSLISWIITLKEPFLHIMSFSFSGSDLILLVGGFFLFFKAISELYERLEYKEHQSNSKYRNASFYAIVIQIVIIDAVFSLDSIITAIGIVNNLTITITAIVIAMVLMLLIANLLTKFINNHNTIVLLFLSFLLLIGMSLIAEGLGFHIKKGYLYTAISFSILIELLNQIAWRNFIKYQSAKLLREHTIEAIMHFINKSAQFSYLAGEKQLWSTPFSQQEYHLLDNVLSLASKNLCNIMTPRNKINWLNNQQSLEELTVQIINTQHYILPLCDGNLDSLIGLVRVQDLIVSIANGKKIKFDEAAHKAIVVSDNLNILTLLIEIYNKKEQLLMVIVVNQLGIIQGIITPIDILVAITDILSDKDKKEKLDIQVGNDRWLAKGNT
ncbi:TerC family protein [Candidatus Palibaumannia cicadellinicola]|uniref:Membrane protein, TerC family n=1 Tax=Baumannia cicadellinicola subsp. Homalodisca coagulata TaxID=374463 RepID=Q1LT21_BAUCH|nr:tellurium resistance protein TerC [Candidatus Baumannia cicadellinicola]ABF13945.1 membrane protein, TerC family [Baumannia cicadellinicola str. Hc (Homalodisca coagulata)]MCJ7462069.1 tellurium resistance protein TerC [Candidatus Baumannia cicadellinicola]MCJ7462650.1 tellurium resistance protein TerC [Candidatus Baumannia cicadellinicola]